MILAIVWYVFRRWFICTFSCFSNSKFWSFLPSNTCFSLVNPRLFFTEFDLPWLSFSNSLCKHGPKTVFGIVLYIGWWKGSHFFSFYSNLKKKSSRGFIFTVRKYRLCSLHNLPLFTSFCFVFSWQRIELQAVSTSSFSNSIFSFFKLLFKVLQRQTSCWFCSLCKEKKSIPTKQLYRKGMHCCYSIASDIQRHKSIIVEIVEARWKPIRTLTFGTTALNLPKGIVCNS